MAQGELPDILTAEEEHLLLDSFNPRYPTGFRNRCMIGLALKTGMRIGDLIKLKWEDIELDSGRTHIKRGKGSTKKRKDGTEVKKKKDRVVFIRNGLLSDLVDLAAKMGRERSGLVFTTLQGKPVQDQYLRRMITAKAKKAGIMKRVENEEGELVWRKRVHFHLLRHTYLTKLYARTKDIRLVQEVAGHADISTTMIYTHVSGEDVRAAMLDGDEPTPPASLGSVPDPDDAAAEIGLELSPEEDAEIAQAIDKTLRQVKP